MIPGALLALATATGLKPLKPDLAPPLPWTWIVGAALVTVILAWPALRWRAPRSQRESAETRSPQSYRRRLQAARQEGWLAQSEQLAACELMSEALRDLARLRFGISSLRLTTSELLEELETRDVPLSFCDPLGDVLSACDLVKFAGARIAPTELRGYLETALILVDALEFDQRPSDTGEAGVAP